jgi:purine-binding chemotaxis protein CheW
MEYSIEEIKNDVSLELQSLEKVEKIQLIIFKLGDEEYGLSIDQIKEVVLTPNIAKVPQVPSYIKGVANIRGNIIAILDLEEKFGMKKSKIDQDINKNSNSANYTLVVESDKYKVGVLVKEVPNTLSVSLKDIENYTHFASNSSDENYIKGVAKFGKRIIIMIDMIKLTESESLSMNNINKAIQ